MANIDDVAFVRANIEEQTVADPALGLRVRRAILGFSKDHRHPVAADLLKTIEALDRALVEGAHEVHVSERRTRALVALQAFEELVVAGNVVPIDREYHRP